MKKRVLVLGGGFAGLEAAIHPSKGGLDVTLVSNRPYLYIYPTSIWVVTGERENAQVTLDLADVARRHGFRFLRGAVQSVDGARRTAVADGQELAAATFPMSASPASWTWGTAPPGSTATRAPSGRCRCPGWVTGSRRAGAPT